MQAVSPDLILSDGVFGFDASTFIPVELGESIQFGQNARLNKIIPVNQSKIVPTRSHLVPVMELGKRLLQSSRDGDTDGVRELMGKGAPFSTDWLGTSPLHFAAQGNHIKTCEVLLRAGISKDARTKVDRTPLHMAAYEGHADIVELLLKNGAEINSKDMLKMTPLHWAVQNEHIECIKILLSYGATVDVVSKFDKTPISMAIEQERVDIVHLLQMAMKIMVERAQSMEIQRATLAATQSLTQELEQNDEDVEVINNEETIVDGGEEFRDESSVDNNSVCDVVQVQDNIKSDSNNLKNAFKVLENHGLTLVPNSPTLSNSVPFTLESNESTNQIVLSENGKLTLNLSKSNRAIISNQNNEIASSPQIECNKVSTKISSPIKLKGRKVITIRSDQFLALTGGKYQHMFKKLTQNNSETRNNMLDNIMHNKPIKRIVMTKNKITVAPKATAIQLPQVKINTLEKIECVTKQLQEARRIAEDYKQKYKQKEKECAEYEKQLKLLSFL